MAQELNTVVFITYDGIDNSVFLGQVLEPLLKLKRESPCQVLLVSFEKNLKPHHYEQACKELGNNNVIILRRFSFLGKVSLYHSIIKFKKILSSLSSYSLIARGPLAGFIALKAANQQCSQLTIQARGLLSAEYDYAYRNCATALKPLHWLRSYQLHAIEKLTYKVHTKTFPITIEAVSPAMKHYLTSHFRADDLACTIAHYDIPHTIASAQKLLWRTAVRKQLSVDESTHIYCYNGSAKAWQCPQETINYFKEQLNKNPNSFLLVLTQDVQAFNELLHHANLPEHSYYACYVNHKEMYKYLSAADTGIIFRESHILNWVSRPTKALEYKSVGLKIAHNNTVGFLVDTK